MTKLRDLQHELKRRGFPASAIRTLRTVEDAEDFLSRHDLGLKHVAEVEARRNGKAQISKPKPRARAKKKGAIEMSPVVRKKKKAVSAKRGPGRPRGSTNKATAVKRGRPKGSTNKPKTTAKTQRNGSGDGRHLLGDLNYNLDHPQWNPREGSPPDRIMKALKKFKGNRDKVYDYLLPDLNDFAPKKTNRGGTRTKQEQEDMLRYRIARTEWDFAVKTKQHKKATNRVEYGTGGTGNGSYKPAKKSKSNSEAPRRRGRPPGSKSKDTAKRGPGRPKGSTTKRGPGRPRGSRNKARR